MDARPDLNWKPYPLHHPQPRSAYLHVVVVELESTNNPTPGVSRTALYTVPILPEVPLEVGQYVHLHLLCANKPDARLPNDLARAMALPTPVAGRLEAERTRYEGEVEFVLKNEIAEARVKSAVVRIRHVPNVSVKTGTSGLLLAKLQRLAADRGEQGPQVQGEAAHPMYPRGAAGPSDLAAQDLKWKAPLDTDNWAVPRRKPRTAKAVGGSKEGARRRGAGPRTAAGRKSGVCDQLSKERSCAENTRSREGRESHPQNSVPASTPIDAHASRDRSRGNG